MNKSNKDKLITNNNSQVKNNFAINGNDILENENALLESFDKFLIISKCPKRLIKKGTSSQSGTQFDISFKCESLPQNIVFDNIKVKSFIVSINQDGSFNPTEINSKLEVVGHRNWILKNMRVKSNDNRRSSKNSISEKSVILLDITLDVKMNGKTLSWTKKLYSEPVVIIVHSNQENDAQLTLFIDDYFRTDRNSFIESRGFPLKTTTNSGELLSALSDYFIKETGRGLTDDNKTYLLDKINNQFNCTDIPISDVIKKLIPHSKLSFGQWIISLIRLCKNDHINKLWVNNFIEGFVTKDVGYMLPESGSYLLRFAERQTAIGVVLKSESNEVKPWAPFTEIECRKINLANRLCDFPGLRLLRKASGTLVSTSDALSDYIDKRDVAEGYTKRGGSFSSQMSHDDDIGSQTTPKLDDIVDDGEFGDDDLLDMTLDRNVGDTEDMDINEISDICNNLLKMESII